jgi:hypothetical protein
VFRIPLCKAEALQAPRISQGLVHVLFGEFEHHFQVAVGDFIPNTWAVFNKLGHYFWYPMVLMLDSLGHIFRFKWFCPNGFF